MLSRANGNFLTPFLLAYFLLKISAAPLCAQNNRLVDPDSINRLNTLGREMLDRVPDSALKYSEKALEAAEETNFKRGMAEAMTNLGFYYLDRAEYASSYEYFNRVYSLRLDMQDSVGMTESLANLAAVYRQRGLYPEARQYLLEALELARQLDHRGLLATLYKDLGGVSYFIQNYEEAQQYFQESLNYINPTRELVTYAAVLNNIGVVYKAWNRNTLALEYLQKSYKMLQKQGSVRDLSANLMNIGEVYERLGNTALAEDHYFRALSAAKRVNNIQRLVEAYEYLANFYAAGQRYQLAFKYQQLYNQYRDTLYNEEANLRMAEMAKKLELERKERAFNQLLQDKELEILNQENEITKLELFRKTNQVYLIILAMIVIGTAAFVLYRSYRAKNKQNVRLADQNQLLQEMNLKLQQSEQKLKELNETKDKFFGILAHDLRSPLASLRGLVQVLNLDYKKIKPEDVGRFTAQIERNLQALTSLMDNLLQWATSQTGIIEFAPEKINVLDIVAENLELLDNVAQAKGVQLENLVEADTVAYADDQMIRLIVRNLVSNAIKFTPKGGQVSVSAWENSTATNIVVSDTGVGMDEENLAAIREQGMAKSHRGTNNEKGSGLGLVLCQDFIQKHHGRLEVESEPGQGTVFTVVFPKEKVRQPAPTTGQPVH